MPIQTSDLHLRLSITTGTAGNQNAQPAPNASLGKYISTTDIVDNTLDNLFGDITGDQNAAGQVDYRCVFIYNAHGTLTLQNTVVWLSGQRFTADSTTDTFTCNGHGFSNGDTVRVEAERNTDTLPAGVTNATTYYVVGVTTNTFQLSATQGGAAIDLTANGTGAVRQYGNTADAIAVDNVAASAIGSSTAQADNVANTTTAPTAVGAFSSPTTKAAGLSLGNIGPGQCRAFWLRRTALNAGARNYDGVNPRVEGDTAA